MSKQPTIRKRRVGKHRRGCEGLAVVTDGDYHNPWITATLKHSGHNGRECVELACADFRCSARLQINLDDMLAAVGEGKP